MFSRFVGIFLSFVVFVFPSFAVGQESEYPAHPKTQRFADLIHRGLVGSGFPVGPRLPVFVSGGLGEDVGAVAYPDRIVVAPEVDEATAQQFVISRRERVLPPETYIVFIHEYLHMFWGSGVSERCRAGDDSACGVWFDDGRDVEEGLVEAVAWDAAPAVLRKAHRSFVGSVYGVEMAYSEQVRDVWEYSEFVSGDVFDSRKARSFRKWMLIYGDREFR